MSEPKPVRVFLRGSFRLRDTLLSTETGGSELPRGIAEATGAKQPGYRLELMFEEGGGAESFARDLDSGTSGAAGFDPEIVVLSLDADLEASDGQWGNGLVESFLAGMRHVIQTLKTGLHAHVFLLSVSSLVPDEIVSNYRSVDSQPRSLDAHRLNLAAMTLSFEEGISIIDADRLIAELGGAAHVRGFLDYSPAARETLVDEFVRVAEDYGFFDSRPILPQVGNTAAGQ